MAITFKSFSYKYNDIRGMLVDAKIVIPNGESVSSITGKLYGASSDIAFISKYNNNSEIPFTDEIGNVTSVNGVSLVFDNNAYSWSKIWKKYWAYKLVLNINGSEIVVYSESNIGNYYTINGKLSTSNFSENRGKFNEELKFTFLLRNLQIGNFQNWTGLVKKVEVHSKLSISNGTTLLVKGNNGQTVVTNLVKSEDVTSTMVLEDKSVIEFQTGVIEETPYVKQKVESFTPIKPINIIDNITLDVIGIHGSILYNGYFYGTCRSVDSLNPYNLVKIDVNNPSNIKYFSIKDKDLNNLITNIEHVIQYDKYLYMSSSFGFVRFNVEDETYIYKRGDFKEKAGSSSVPILTDGVFIYQTISKNYLQKYNITDFDDNTKNFMKPVLETSIDLGSEITGNAEVHSSSLDDEFIYLAYTSYVTSYKSMIVKARKSDLVVVAKEGMVQTTDDMTADENYLYLGSENQVLTKYGHDVGAVGVRKLDMKVFESNALDEFDIAETTSYASLFFGKTLIDSKTNGTIYILDTQNVEHWNINIAPQMVKARYKYDTTSQGVLQGIINELAYDYETNTFYGFVWRNLGNGKSRYVSFKLPDLILIQKPIISYATYDIINVNTQFKIKGSLISSGGVSVSDCGFVINEDGVEEIVKLSNDLGVKEYILNTEAKVASFYFYATNSEGRESSIPVTLPISYNYNYIIAGKVYYKTDTILSNAKVILIDTSNSTIVDTTTSGVLGEYSFNNLIKNRKYLLSAYSGGYRSLSKLVIPTEELL